MTTPCGPEGRSSRGFGKMSLSDYSCKQFLGDQPHALGTAALQLERMANLWRTTWTWTTTFAVLTGHRNGLRQRAGAALAAAAGPRHRALRRWWQFRRHGADRRSASHRCVRADLRSREPARR